MIISEISRKRIKILEESKEYVFLDTAIILKSKKNGRLYAIVGGGRHDK